MQSKGLIIIIAAVLCMMVAMVLLVVNFNDMSAYRSLNSSERAVADSVASAQFVTLQQQDSLLQDALVKHEKAMADMQKQINIIKYKFTLLAE